MTHSVKIKQSDQALEHATSGHKQHAPLYVSVRGGHSVVPAIDITALKLTAESMKKTLEELDGACG